MLPSGLMINSDSGIKSAIDQRFNPVFIRALEQTFVRVVAIGVFLVIAGTVVRSLLRMFFTFWRTSSFHFPATFFANSDMKITGRIGAIDHTVGFNATDMTDRHNCRVDFIYVNRDPVIKNIAFPFKILSSGFNAVPDDPSVKLINILKTLFKQVSRGFFAFDPTST